jgi:diguanylate cyclase (GGDEF)-like protein/PAS domain S-box-containing protein
VRTLTPLSVWLEGATFAMPRKPDMSMGNSDTEVLDRAAGRLSDSGNDPGLLADPGKTTRNRGVADDALRESETRYRRLFETARDGILLLNAVTGQIEDANPYLVDMLGYSHAEFLGKKLWEVGTFADIPQSKEMFLKLQTEGYVRYDDLPLKTREGKKIQVEFVSNSYDVEGTKVIQCNIRNITARKLAESAVQREQHFTNVALDSLPGLFYCISAEGQFLRWNKNFESLSGYSAEEISQLHPTKLFVESDRGRVAKQIAEAFLIGQATLEADFLAKDQSSTPYVFTGARVELDEQPCLTGMGINVTALNRVKAERERLAAILESTSDLVSMSDASGQLLYLNRAGREALGVGLDEEITRARIADFIPDPDNHLTSTIGIPTALREGVWTGETELLSRCGRAIAVSQVILAHKSADGNLEFLSTIMRDITERKQADLKIERLNRIYAVLSGINSLIVRVDSREELYTEACRITVEKGAFRMAWIGMIDPQTLDGSVVGWFGGQEGYIDKIRLTAREGTPDSDRPACVALRLSKPVICNDIATEPTLATLRDDLLARGHKSVACFPLSTTGQPEGVLVLFAGESNVFDEDEIRLLLELAGDITFALDHIRKTERINYLAYYDALTGLANRTLFHERLEQGVTNAKEQGHKLGLVLLDVERFKAINDTLGEQAGDAVLRELAARMSASTANNNRLARLGADHFAEFIPELEIEEKLARIVEQRLALLFDPQFQIGDATLSITAKAGIAMFPTDGSDVDSLLKNAEAALRIAKASGEPYVFYTRSMNARVASRLSLENQLRQALERNEFVLHYQPKVNMANGKVTGAEALIRWNNPQTGKMVPPNDFIPILEESGMIHEVGRWAKRRAIKDYLRWRAAGLPAVRLSVNVSPVQLRHRDFVGDIAHTIGIDANAPSGLELEITEGVFMTDIDHSIASLKAIRAMGVTIAIDDFGTGFSCLSYLAQLPVDRLKIDRSFVVNMTAGPEGMALVSTVINLAHALKMTVVAEGVETEEQSLLLRQLGCEEMQGYLFSKPVPGDVFEARILRQLA